MRLSPALLVEDDDTICDEISAILEKQFRISRATDGKSAFAALEAQPRPEVAITDVHLPPGQQGLAVAVRAAQLDVPVLLITGDMPLAEQLEAEGHSVLRKPFRLPELMRRVRREVERSHSARAMLRANAFRLR